MKSKAIINSILEENVITAKKLIAEDLVIKLGQRLAEEYIRVAKETFNEEEEEKGKRWQDSDGDGKWYEEGEDVNVDEEGEEDEEGEDEEGCGEDKEEKE
jgi:hypothetical protein